MARRIPSSRMYRAVLQEYVDQAQANRERDRDAVKRVRAATRDAAPSLPYRVPRAPEWVYRRLAGLPAETHEPSVTDEDLDLERRIEDAPRRSLDGFDELVGGAW